MSLRLPLCAALLWACTPSTVEENDELRQRATDAIDVSALTTAALVLVDDGRAAVRDAVDGQSSTLPLLPLGCATVFRAKNQFSFAYAGCRGGGPGLDGKYTVSIDLARGERSVMVRDLDLVYGAVHVRGEVTLSAERDLGSRTVQVEVGTNLEGTLASGAPFAVDGTVVRTRAIGGTCTTLEGSLSTRVGDRTAALTIASWRRCAGACPEAGATLTAVQPGESDAVITWDGTDRAAVSVDGEARASVAVRCGGE